MIWMRFQFGPDIGMGHAVRSLALAKALTSSGQAVGLMLDSDAGELEGVGDLPVLQLDPGDNLPAEGHIIFDMSHAGARDNIPAWVKYVQKAGNGAVVVDGLGPDAYIEGVKADVVLTPYLMSEAARQRAAKTWLSGPQFSILSDEYAQEPSKLKSRPNVVMISIGGADPWALTETALEAALNTTSFPRFEVKVVAGPQLSTARRTHLTTQCKKSDVELLDAPDSLRDLLGMSAVAVLGPGLTKYEAAACNTPAVILAPDADTLAINMPFAEAGLASVMDASARNFSGQLGAAIASQATKRRSSWTGRALIDGKGAARAAEAIIEALGE